MTGLRPPRPLLLACLVLLHPPPATSAPALPPQVEKAVPPWVRLRLEGKPDNVIQIRPDGTGRTEFTVPPLVGEPAPDGKRTAYVAEAGDERTVHVADADGRNARRVTPAGLAVQSDPRWSDATE